MIIDASVVLSAFFPDEAQDSAQAVIRDHVSGRACLAAPTLITYEVANAVLQAVRRGRASDADALAILTAIEGLEIETVPVPWREVFAMARRFDRSAYDAAYLALAAMRGEPLVTGDLRLANAVRAELDWVRWIGDV